MKRLGQLLYTLMTTRWYWTGLLVLGLFMEGVALYWQYVVGDEPCQICIHVRVWVAAFTLLALLMCLLPRRPFVNLAGHALAVVCMVGLLERCKYLLDVENGKGEGSCQFFLGYPEWFALDAWMPWMFEVRNLCGFTPQMWFGVSMAQWLMVASVGLLIASVLALALNIHALRETR